MSLDYPNRDVWLAKRATPRKLNLRRYLWTKGTYSNGQRTRKDVTWAVKQTSKAARRAAKRAA